MSFAFATSLYVRSLFTCTEKRLYIPRRKTHSNAKHKKLKEDSRICNQGTKKALIWATLVAFK
jgi:hypothetical protein